MTASQNAPQHALALDKVSFSYGKGGVFSRKMPPRVLHEVSLKVESGKTTGLVGESGSGKSTIAKLMLGLVDPTGGQVLLDGKPLDALSRLDRAKTLQMVFQDPYSSLNPRVTIEDILVSPLRTHGIGDRASRLQSARHMMDAVGLVPAFASRYPRELSGGQRQRVAIARALMLQPKVVICDEPTSALDVSVQSQILNLLLSLQRDFGLGYLFISHNLAVVQHISDDVVVLKSGDIVERGTAQDVYFAPSHPYTLQLIGATLAPP